MKKKGKFISSGITDALLTTLTIILLSAYTGIHFYIRFLLHHHQTKEDFTVIAVRK
jgi:hypothetical protein